jgi:hypothetical protein
MCEGSIDLALRQQCQEDEARFKHVDIEKVKREFLQLYLFSPRAAEHCAPFQREGGLRMNAALDESKKYRALLESIRQAETRQDELWIVAWYLRLENVCEPEEIVGAEELRRLSQKYFGFMSAPEFRYAATVIAWLPYFEKLLTDFRAKKSMSKLIERGYDASAVTAALDKRTAVPAVCQWLAGRSGPTANASSYANAYSRIYGKRQRPSLQRFL